MSKHPTRIYTYGLHPAVSGKQEFDFMLRAGCLYYNALLEIYKNRLKSLSRFWAELGSYTHLLDEQEALEEESRKRLSDERKNEVYSRLRELEKEIKDSKKKALELALSPEELFRIGRKKEINRDLKSRDVSLSEAELEELLDSDPRCVSPRRRFQLDFIASYKSRGMAPSGKKLNLEMKRLGLGKKTQDIEDKTAEDIRKAREFYKIYYGTYSLVQDDVERAIDTSDTFPAFKAWTGEGRVGAPIDTNTGLSLDSLFDSSFENGEWSKSPSGNSVLQISPVPDEVYELKRLKNKSGSTDSSWTRKTRTHMRICIDSLGRSGRSRIPVWVHFHMVMHRPIPKGSKIVGAWVHVFKRGSRLRYELQIQVQSDTFNQSDSSSSSKTITAVNLGYRKFGRVATSLTQNGQFSELLMDPRVSKKIDNADNFRKMRTDKANYLKKEILDLYSSGNHIPVCFSKGQGDFVIIPHWSGDGTLDRKIGVRTLSDKIQNLSHAREISLPRKLLHIMNDFRKALLGHLVLHYFTGSGLLRPDDISLFDKISEWASDDKYYENHEAGNRFKSRGIRKNQIMVWAHKICDVSSVILVENTKYSLIKLKKKPIDSSVPKEKFTEIARRRDFYAPGETRRILEEVAKKRGVLVKKILSVNLTQIHHSCGDRTPWDAFVSINHICVNCNQEFDQDVNFCEGLFIRDRNPTYGL